LISYFDNPRIVARVFYVDIYKEETERRWQIPRTKIKIIYECQEKEVISS